ncbi:MAG: endonuclease/exonuclease/phosphatase family protein [Hydrogenophaga sp.]|nr:endonuclease/exonuclease/phosphatase family protein [Hydrogenophaga sp.]
MKRDGQCLRVLTVNIHKGYSVFNKRFVLHELREAVRAVESDVVFLQEVRGASEAGAEQQQAAQYEFLADSIWSDHAYGRNAAAPRDSYGNAVLSHYPIVHSHNHRLSVPRIVPQRGLLHCLVNRGSMPPLHLMCVHLGLLESDRQDQLGVLCEVVAREVPPGEPLIVAGDFNDWRLKSDARLRDIGLVEVFHQAFGRHARSFPAAWPLLRLDRIYVRDVRGVTPLPMPRHPWARLSDHAPLAAEVLLGDAP